MRLAAKALLAALAVSGHAQAAIVTDPIVVDVRDGPYFDQGLSFTLDYPAFGLPQIPDTDDPAPFIVYYPEYDNGRLWSTGFRLLDGAGREVDGGVSQDFKLGRYFYGLNYYWPSTASAYLELEDIQSNPRCIDSGVDGAPCYFLDLELTVEFYTRIICLGGYFQCSAGDGTGGPIVGGVNYPYFSPDWWPERQRYDFRVPIYLIDSGAPTPAPVPLPASAALLAGGMAALAVWRRKRRQH